MVCPTDDIESNINSRFKGRNYFISSLGNTITLEKNTLQELTKLILEKKIREIVFVLSEDNQIILDAINHQDYIQLNGLSTAYNCITEHKKNTDISWKTYDRQAMVLSYHLNSKIKEMREELRKTIPFSIEFEGKIFSKHYNNFRNIYSPLACINSINLN